MPKFFQVEKAAYAGDKDTFRNVKFKKNNFDNSSGAEAGTLLEIIPVHIKNPPVIQFIAYMDNLQDKIASQQSKTQPFGRTDPYYIWKSNNRTITVSFKIPSSSVATGLDNLNNLSWFLASLYPTYKETATATSIAASPMFRIRYGNLICSSTRDGQGILGVIQNVSVTHDLKDGVIGIKTDNMGSSFSDTASKLLKEAGFDNSVREGKKFLIPKFIKVGFSINVVHDHSLGWDYNTGQWRGGLGAPRFPYDFGLLRDTSDTPSVGVNTSNDAQPSNNATPGSVEAKEVEKRQSILNDTTGTGLESGPINESENPNPGGTG